MYLTNDTTEEVGEFALPQDGWSPSTQEEIDAYLLQKAKDSKVSEVVKKLSDFQEAGYEYDGAIVCDDWSSSTTYNKYDLVYDTVSEANYKSLKDDNLNNPPESSPVDWALFTPVFKTDQCCMVNLSVQDGIDAAESEKYKFFCRCDSIDIRLKINFDDAVNWLAFTKAMRKEQDRVMKKYNAYRTQIAKCATVAAVEAITIDFSA
jgi:hypothetical protein